MRNRVVLNSFFNRDRKSLFIILSIVMISVLTLTVVYAALSTTLNINGNAEVTAASWDIYLDNVQLNSQSATTNVPTITDKTTASFSTILSKPGDFYEFTVDVVNNGSIDAMIDSIIKTPELTTVQAKYLNYIIEYQNGESITNKQLVSKKSYVRLLVKVEYRKDILSSDLPTALETLDFSFIVNYVQSDESAINVEDNGVWMPYKVISGDLKTVGSEVAIGDEHFYVISSDEDSVKLLAKYSLYVGAKYESGFLYPYGEEATGLQNSSMMGMALGQTLRHGVSNFSSTAYWSSTVSEYPVNVYDNNSNVYDYVENYKHYLQSKGANIEDAHLILLEELEELGCNLQRYSCSGAPTWLYKNNYYWTGVAYNSSNVWYILNSGSMFYYSYNTGHTATVRPVVILKI